MQFDRRRITNGLAWAGAALIVAIPTADLIARQFASAPEPQVAVVQEEPAQDAAEMPTPVAERPAPATPATAAEAEAPPAAAEPVRTAEAATSTSGGDAVDSYLQSGRPLPSYISNGDAPAPAAPATPAPAPRPAISPPSPAATPQPAPVATTQPQVTPPFAAPTKVVTFPTPVSERPASVAARPPAPVVAAPPAVNQPPLIVDNPAPVVTAQDLEDWESGPLSEFLANRRGQGNPPPSDYDAGGFWLDQGPGSGPNRPYPPAYGDTYYYPFGQ